MLKNQFFLNSMPYVLNSQVNNLDDMESEKFFYRNFFNEITQKF